MGSFSMEEFIGNGSLKPLLPKLLEEGWDDVPTLKLMNSADMNQINMNQQQKEALKIRSYLHNHALMQYADKLEASGKCLTALLSLSTAELMSQFGMKRGHIARFMDRTPESGSGPSPAAYLIPARRQTTMTSRSKSITKIEFSTSDSRTMRSMTKSLERNSTSKDVTLEQSIADFKIKDGHVFKGVIAAMPAESRACGCVQPPPIIEEVAPYSAIENILVHKLTPEYKVGMEALTKIKTSSMKASELWQDKPAVFLCIRRPGCIMCRAEAHQLYSRKPIFDALGVQLFAVLHEHIESEVNNFWPRYWGGVILSDRGKGFFKALGGGKLLKEKFISGFLLNPRAIANYKRAKATGVEQNFKGNGEIKGGLFIVGKGRRGIVYQFIERNFGDWAPLSEVVEICTRLQNQQQSQTEFVQSSQDDE